MNMWQAMQHIYFFESKLMFPRSKFIYRKVKLKVKLSIG